MISDEAVEAAAKAAAKDDAEPNWYLETERFRDAWRIRMRAALAAAAPFIAAQAWDEAADATIDYAWLLTNSQDSDPAKPVNPYRSGT